MLGGLSSIEAAIFLFTCWSCSAKRGEYRLVDSNCVYHLAHKEDNLEESNTHSYGKFSKITNFFVPHYEFSNMGSTFDQSCPLTHIDPFQIGTDLSFTIGFITISLSDVRII